jgi:hypothetical protein
MATPNKVKIHIELGEEEYRIGDGSDTSDRVPYGEVIGLETEHGYVVCKIDDEDTGDHNAYMLAGPNLTSGLIQLAGTTKEHVEFPPDEDEEDEPDQESAGDGDETETTDRPGVGDGDEEETEQETEQVQ